VPLVKNQGHRNPYKGTNTVNYSPNFAIVNPLADTIREGEEIIEQLQEAADNLTEAIRIERDARARFKDAQDHYDMAEYDAIAESVIMGQSKEGPLAGIAVSGKGYDIVLTKLKNDLKRGDLFPLANDLDRYRRSYELAQVQLAQAETRFNALRKIAEIKANVLRAATI
jgi:hypothetical protein